MKPKVKIKKESIENFDFMKTNKDNLKNIIKDNTILPIIEELVIRTIHKKIKDFFMNSQVKIKG